MPPRRFTFKIDPKTPVKDLLPPAPELGTTTPPWLVKDLTQVPEVMFAHPIDGKKLLAAGQSNADKSKPATSVKRFGENEDKAMEKTVLLMAKINLINQQDPEYLLRVLRKTRPDLEGLPFIMGDACRQSKSRSLAFLRGVSLVINAMAEDGAKKVLRDDASEAMT